MGTTLTILTKTATLVLLKLKMFLNKGYNVIISFSVHDVTNKSLSCDQSLVTLAFLWEKLS